MKKILPFFFFLLPIIGFSQVEIFMQNGVFTTCNAVFTDSGGPNGNYSNDENFTITFCPENPDEWVVVSFLEFAIQVNTELMIIYDGDSVNAPSLGSFAGSDIQQDVFTANNSSGCLTFSFFSNSSGVQDGWIANVSCDSGFIIGQPSDFEVCDNDGDGSALFDLTTKDAEILGSLDPAQYSISYHLSFSDALTNTFPLPSPFQNSSNPQTIYASVLELSTGNIEVTSFDLIIGSFVSSGFSTEQIECGTDGFAVFDLTASTFDLTGGNPNLQVTYFESFDDAINNVNQIVNEQTYANIQPFFQQIFVRITDLVTGCVGVNDNTSLFLNVIDFPAIQPQTLTVCESGGDGIVTVDLSQMDAAFLNGVQFPTVFVTYHETQQDADNFTNVLDPIYTNVIPFAQTLFVRVGDLDGICFQTTTLELVVDVDCVTANPVTISLCAPDPNADVEVDLTIMEQDIIGGQDPSEVMVTYHQTQADADGGNNPITNPTQYTVPTSPITLFVRVENIASNNFAVTTFSILFNYGPDTSLEPTYTICDGEFAIITPSNLGPNFSFLWSTGSTDPEILVGDIGTYSVEIIDNTTGCSRLLTTEVLEGFSPVVVAPSNIISCEPNPIFDLTSTIPEILNGANPNDFMVGFFTDINDAFLNIGLIPSPSAYSSPFQGETIYVRVQNMDNDCFQVTNFDILAQDSCPVAFECIEGPINQTFCYDDNQEIPYTFESIDGLPLQVLFNAGQVEVNFDELIVLDSDGTTNLNANNPYGNNGDLAGLSFTSSGSSITVIVASDVSINCNSQNYTLIDFDVSCADPNALPFCNSELITPLDQETDVDVNTDLSWTNAQGVVLGYKVSLGLTPGGTEIFDDEDVGSETSFDIGTLEYETTYYATIVPYNSNGDATGCTEYSFTTGANPNQILICNDGAVNTNYCYENNDDSEFSFQSDDGTPLTLIFNSGSTETSFDEIYIIDSDGTILNPNLPYGNAGDFTGLTYTSSGDTISVVFDSDGSISCDNQSSCCTEPFDFDVFCANTVGFIQVNAFVDLNTDGVFDANEPNFSNGYFTYEMNNDGMINTVNSSNGSFQIISANDTDTYDITFNLYDESEACYDVTIASFTGVTVATGNTVTIDFPVVEEQSCEDLAVYLISNWAPPRPGFDHDNYLYFENLGFTTIASGTIEYVVDPLLVFNNTFNVNTNYTITPTATGFTVDFVNLQPGETASIGISLSCPVTVALDEIVTGTATYLTDSNDLVASNNVSTLSEIVVGSWDPNDKMESRGPEVDFAEFASSDQWLYYTIRFQNLGTAEAIFVRIEDRLDDQLDVSTFQMLESSHDYVVTRTERDLEWFFDDIFLPAEQDDADGSIGFIYFRIKPLPGYGVGDVIPNTAAIYFDFNAPVITNRFETEFVEDNLSVDEFKDQDFTMYPNPANNLLNIKLNRLFNAELTIIDIQGKLVSQQAMFNQQQIELNVADLEAGMYFVKLESDTATTIKKLIIR